MKNLNQTHDPALRSWVQSANQDHCDFPIQNLPFGVFKIDDTDESFRTGIAIGDQILDLAAVGEQGILSPAVHEHLAACSESTLNNFMAMGQAAWSALRLELSRALDEKSVLANKLKSCLVPQAAAAYRVPADIGDYTDFYASIHHANNIGKLFRPDNPLLPNYQWVPIGYHGRSSSIGISGQEFPRPVGQIKLPDDDTPHFGPSRKMDYELEVGIFAGTPNALGESIAIETAEEHVFGLCLLNDWSARDIQAWEYQPLGPFLAKNFASTLSPWIVTMEALAPFRLPWTRPDDHPQPLAYLESEDNRNLGAFDIQLEVLIETQSMRSARQSPHCLSGSNFRDSYWTIAQLVAHHTVNGCNLNPGDLFGSGTMSGADPDQGGALIELTRGGKHPVELCNGETRTFLQDNDRVIMRACCENDKGIRIGFGEVTGTVLPTREY